MSSSQLVRVFFSYAKTAAKDRNLFARLKKQLYAFKKQGLIYEWVEGGASVDNGLEQFIGSHSNSLNIIILLFSPDFLNNYEQEVQQAFDFGRVKKAHVIPVLLFDVVREAYPVLTHCKFLPSDGLAIGRRSGQEEALLQVANEIWNAIKGLGTSTAANLQRPESLLESIPYGNNPFFTDRDDILEMLHLYFVAEQAVQQPRIQALKGIAGVGKTQIVIEYLYRYEHEYQKVFWLEADTHHNLCVSINSLDEQFFRFNQEQVSELQLFLAFRRWLQRHHQWLLVLDNLDNPKDFDLINLFVPHQGDGHVLLVTCSQTTGPVRAVAVEPMTEQDGTLLLLRRAKKLEEQVSLEEFSETNITQARAIVQELSGLPLALDQAGAYMEETQCNLSDYALIYQLRRDKLLATRGQFVAYHPDPVATTFSLAFEKVRRECAEVLELLRLFAFLHPDAIPDAMIEQGVLLLDRALQKLVSDLFQWKNAIATLLRYSLIHYNSDTKTVSMHRLVQIVLIDELTPRQRQQWAIRVVRLINGVFPEVNFNNWSVCADYLPHAQKCAELIIEYQLKHESVAYLLERLGCYCYLRACYADAERYLTYAMKVCKKALGPEHQHMAQVLNTLAMLYRKVGRYQEAEEYYRKALAIREGAAEPDNDKIAQVLNNLALLYKDQGRYKEAESLLLKIDEIVVERDHPDMAIFLSNLGQVYEEQERYVEAERLYRSALDIEERLLAANHPNRALSLQNLAGVLEKQGDYQEAEELYHQALEILERSVGLEHVDTARGLNNLANLYVDQKKYQEAEELYVRALKINEQRFGADHLETVTVLNNLAYLAQEQGRYQEAEAFYSRAFDTYNRIFRSDRPETATVLHNMGWLHHLMGKDEEAEQLLRRALTIRERVFGPEQLSTAASVSALAKLLIDQCRWEQAEPLYGRVLNICLQRFGPDHPNTTLARETYAFLLEQIAKQKQQ
jgi:tetratricopeptide (TPR) repeat protein